MKKEKRGGNKIKKIKIKGPPNAGYKKKGLAMANGSHAVSTLGNGKDSI